MFRRRWLFWNILRKAMLPRDSLSDVPAEIKIGSTHDRAPLAQRMWAQRTCIAFAAMTVFVTSLGGPFTRWDDNYYVTENVRIQKPGLSGFKGVWDSVDVWAARDLEFFPLRDSLYWATWQIFGENPLPFHVVNIVIHAAVAILVLELARRLGLSPKVSFWGALLFAVHPIHVESVTWIAALKDPLFTGLMVGSVICFLIYRRTLRPRDYALCLGFMIAALLSKSIALVTPLLFLAIDRLLEGRPTWRLSITRVAAPAIISALFFVQFVMIGKLAGVIGAPHGGTWGQHYFLMGWALVRYVQQAFVPATFRIHYCFNPLESFGDARLLGILLFAFVLGISVIAVVRRTQNQVGVLILWFFACLAPVANIIPFPAIMADRYLYAPSVAACLLLSWGMNRLPIMKALLLPAVVALFSVVTLARGVIWENPGNLWAEAVEDDACLKDDLVTASVMYLNHGGTAEDPAVALAAYQKGINHRRFTTLPKHLQALYLRKGIRIALMTGDSELARSWGIRAIEAAPFDPDAWANRALTVGDPAVALDAANHAFRLEKSADTYWLRGAARLAVDDSEGVNDFVTAVDLDRKGHCKYFLLWLMEEQARPFVPRFQTLRVECEATQRDVSNKQSTKNP